MNLWKRITGAVRNALGFPSEDSIFPDFGQFDNEALVPGTSGPKLKDLVPGEFFAVIGKENYPKVKLEGGAYYDLSFQLRHNAPNPEWRTVLYTREQVREIFLKKGVPADRIDTLIEQRRTIDHDGQI